MTKNIIVPGDQFAKKGTTAWADWQRSRLKDALKDVHFEARQIVQVIRDMCGGDEPAWHLMTRSDGVGFRAFVEFVTAPPPDGLGFPDYPKFRGIAVSEPGIMNEREYDLLTATPAMSREEAGKEKGHATGALPFHDRTVARLRAINRAPALVRKLYVAELIDAKLAELLGPDEHAPGYQERKAKADRAMAAIQGISRNGNETAYRKAVNSAVRQAFARAGPSHLDALKRIWSKATARERKNFLAWVESGKD
jgi:hypothetical protein